METEKRGLNKPMRIGGSMILDTPQERVKLLKAGVYGKLIEKLYVKRNNFKIVSDNVLFDLTNDINIRTPAQNMDNRISSISRVYLNEINLSISAAGYENAFIVSISEQK